MRNFANSGDEDTLVWIHDYELAGIRRTGQLRWFGDLWYLVTVSIESLNVDLYIRRECLEAWIIR